MQTSPLFDASKLSSDLLLSSTSSTFQTDMKNNFDDQTFSKTHRDGVAEDTNDCVSYCNPPTFRKCATSHISLMGHKETLDMDNVPTKNSDFDKFPYYDNREISYKPTANLFKGENDSNMTEGNDLSAKKRNNSFNCTNTETLNNSKDALQKVTFIITSNYKVQPKTIYALLFNFQLIHIYYFIVSSTHF